MDIDYVACKLFITVLLFGVRPVLAKLQQKNASKNVDFLQKSKVTLFTPKKCSILDETIKVTVQT